MNLVEDESVEGPTVFSLRAAGHEVPFIAEACPGIEDARCWRSPDGSKRFCSKAPPQFQDDGPPQGPAGPGMLLEAFLSLAIIDQLSLPLLVDSRTNSFLLLRNRYV